MIDKKAQPATACRIRRDRRQVELGALIVEVTFRSGNDHFSSRRGSAGAGIRVDAYLLSPEGTTSHERNSRENAEDLNKPVDIQVSSAGCQ